MIDWYRQAVRRRDEYVVKWLCLGYIISRHHDRFCANLQGPEQFLVLFPAACRASSGPVSARKSEGSQIGAETWFTNRRGLQTPSLSRWNEQNCEKRSYAKKDDPCYLKPGMRRATEEPMAPISAPRLNTLAPNISNNTVQRTGLG
jgi:hypothetical protein